MVQPLTLQERGVLYRLRKAGYRQNRLPELTGRHPSTISRELRRNRGQRGYRPQQAQRLADTRRRSCRRPAKLEDPLVHEHVEQKLTQLWSPEQISGRLRARHPQEPRRWVSRQTIYNWIQQRAPHWRTNLRRGGRPPNAAENSATWCGLMGDRTSSIAAAATETGKVIPSSAKIVAARS